MRLFGAREGARYSLLNFIFLKPLGPAAVFIVVGPLPITTTLQQRHEAAAGAERAGAERDGQAASGNRSNKGQMSPTREKVEHYQKLHKLMIFIYKTYQKYVEFGLVAH